MTRQELFIWIRQQYGTEPEYPWHDWNAVLRHNDNNKWYGVVLEVSADKLGLPEAGIVDVLNVKSDPLLIGSLRGQDGYFPAYHMNKEKWLSIQLFFNPDSKNYPIIEQDVVNRHRKEIIELLMDIYRYSRSEKPVDLLGMNACVLQIFHILLSESMAAPTCTTPPDPN